MPEIYLGQWQWVEEDPITGWRMPRLDIGLGSLDLRSLPQMGNPGPTPQGYGIFVLSERDDSVGDRLGDSLGGLVPSDLKTVISSRLGLGESITASTVLDILKELYVRFADPTGLTAMKPLRGSPARGFEMFLGGFGRLFLEKFDPDHPAWATTIAVWKADYRRNKAEGVPLDVLQRFTGASMEKYRVGADALLPPEYVSDGSLRPETPIVDDFTGSDNGLGANWTSDEGTWIKKSNHVECSAARGTVRYSGTSLSSDDHYAQIKNLGAAGSQDSGPIVRKAASGTLTFYYADTRLNRQRLWKRVTGTFNELGTGTLVSTGTDDIIKCEINDTTLKFFLNATEEYSQSDPSISGNLQTGLETGGADAEGDFDDFEADVLVAAAGRLMGALVGHGGLAGVGGIAGRRGGIAG